MMVFNRGLEVPAYQQLLTRLLHLIAHSRTLSWQGDSWSMDLDLDLDSGFWILVTTLMLCPNIFVFVKLKCASSYETFNLLMCYETFRATDHFHWWDNTYGFASEEKHFKFLSVSRMCVAVSTFNVLK